MRFRFPLISLLCIAGSVLNAADRSSELFWLHKFEQPIGMETDSFSIDNQILQIESSFKFTDRGASVPLKGR